MEIYVGIDVAKETQWACALDARAQVLLDRAVENDQAAIEGLVADLRGLGGEVVVGLDITGSLARFLEAILLAEGLRLVHVPGIAVNRAGQGFSGGERKSDPRDVHTIAELVRTRDLRPILPDDETAIALRLKVTRRRELSDDQTRRISRMRQLLGAIHPGLERRLDLTAKGPLVLVTRYVTPAEIRRAGLKRLMAHLKRTPHLHAVEALAQRSLEAAEGQSIAVPGEASFADMIRDSPLRPCRRARRSPASTAIWRPCSSATLTAPSSARCRGWGRCCRQNSSPTLAPSSDSTRPTPWPAPQA
ncbi:hypothetical protein ABIE78_004526 [Sinorhizobium fredii]|uniref:Insertion element IS116 uncharacterized 44.8 kDa protein n=1 Tax=Sinorhizobium fredii (strain USDA 257) TaxID=1185652 RepID=I3X1E6_SINF2|nr:IS110 family transposase [Sinorhizobium fredii]AFL49702.1 insertion element IS116 uncharacterized 44.8 kDa protein [Sinorhizobium fredii USDA 257]